MGPSLSLFFCRLAAPAMVAAGGRLNPGAGCDIIRAANQNERRKTYDINLWGRLLQRMRQKG